MRALWKLVSPFPAQSRPAAWRPARLVSLAWALLAFATNAGLAIETEAPWQLGVEGPSFLKGPAGGVARGAYFVTLLGRSFAGATGADGWSFALRVDGGRVIAITLSGTEGNWSHAGGSERTGLVGEDGATSVVSLPLFARLSPDTRHRIAAVEVEADVGSGGGLPSILFWSFADELLTLDGPVTNAVLDGGLETTPSSTSTGPPVSILRSSDCERIALGFSGRTIDSAVPFSGILGGESAVGSLGVLVPPGKAGRVHVFGNVVSRFRESDPPGLGVQGWSLSISLEGEAECVGATIGGTAADRIFGGGFNKTECVLPSRNFGRRGVTTAMVFTFDGRTLPRVGTASIVDILLEASAPQGSGDQEARLGFTEGLVGSGQPVPSAFTVQGGAWRACNTFEAAATVFFRLATGRFTRGDANEDGRVDLSDAIWILDSLFLVPRPTSCEDAADVDDSGFANITDAIYLLNFQFLGGGPPPAPFPGCGEDATGDLLRCLGQLGCY